MIYKSISVNEWRQFRDIHINLHPSLTILTGPNGSGKSTLLSLLGLSMDQSDQEPFLATPINDDKSGKSAFSIATIFSRFNPFKLRTKQPVGGNDPEDESGFDIGSILYSSGNIAKLRTNGNGLKYSVDLYGRMPIIGFKIDSHRAIPRYQQVRSLPISGITPKDAFFYFSQSLKSYQRGTFFHQDGRSIENPVAPLKETLIGFAAFGTDNTHMRAVPELVGLYDDFQDLLKKVLPNEIGFQKLEVRSPEIVIVSRTGEFPIDSASGGLMSLIQTCWQIFLFTKAYGETAVVLIDEPENHLHPSLQRDFLGKLVKAFSKVQFIVATHSPFVITSVKSSTVYALNYTRLKEASSTEKLAVTVQEIELNSKARPADKILDEVLGVSVTIPIWAERDLTEIANKFEKSNLTSEAIAQLRRDLDLAGLSEFFPEALGKIASD